RPWERSRHTAVYDVARDRMIVLGGENINSEFFTTDPHTDPWVLQFDGVLAVPPVDEHPALPLAALVPNPARTQASLHFALAAGRSAAIRIHDAQGRLVRTLVDGPFAAGDHRMSWDLRDDRG